eukprot:GFUD01078004.1.p1 GENE.GFUD01078004.1~~GFUD01078004.1.p1  ORF type:complete len:540 (-),score=145.79 GFUD01078004.1:76-1695(-)
MENNPKEDDIEEVDDTEEEPPANTIEELLFRELVVLKLGLHRNAKPPFLMRYSEESGRGLIATRNIKTGEIIMEETPAVWGPKAKGACCLECGLELHKLSSFHFCNLCHLHFCSGECCAAHPRPECVEMQKLHIKTDSLEYLGKLTLVIVVLRCLLLPETAPQNWARIRLLQDHLENSKETKLKKLNQKFLVNFLRDIGLDKNQISNKEIHRVCGILDSNAFESITLDGVESRALFPLSALANSSCLPNLTHVTRKDRTMVMVATRDIQEGQELFICYTGIRWGKITRQKHLLLTKHFLCCCPRCLDPTECGTFISSIKCAQCEGNMIQDVQIGSSEFDMPWHCQDCKLEMEHKKVVAVEAMIGQMLKLINKNSTQHLEGASRKLKQLLTSHHYILLEMYMSLVTLYEKKKEKPEKIVELCDILLPVLQKLEGSSRAVALLVISRICAQVSMYKDGKEEFLNSGWFEDSILKFDEAYSLIKYDVQAPVTINELQSTIEILKEERDPNNKDYPKLATTEEHPGKDHAHQPPNAESMERVI